MIHIAAVTDASYLPWTGTMIRSCLLANEPRRLAFHVVHEVPFPPAEERKLVGMIEWAGSSVTLHRAPPERAAELPSTHRVMWLGLLIPELLAELPRVLYLDGDTLVVDSLQELWDTDFAGAPLAAVPNVVEPAMRGHVQDLGLTPGQPVLNGGVQLLNLDAMRAEGSFAQLIGFTRSRDLSELPWFDQDSLNAVYARRWLVLHPRWNAQNSLWTWPDWARETFGEDVVRQATTTPAVLHFEGPHICKPWHYLSNHPWRHEYLRTLALTPWAGVALEDRTPATMCIRRFPGSARLPAFLWLLRWRQRMARRRSDGSRLRRLVKRLLRDPAR